ncbi:MAG: TolC family protein [Leptospira sp.]|uniref:TolC family protein n=1 Tax=Leptospira paudalimensis TaxID=2950024 RepID=A0ABT3M8X5_9LEPT|nr:MULTISPECIES: TolC family protein [Leptospira]MBL0954213.1 TolC family protein [Leptospira sp.]MCW7504481.1 TolC family protein [Leptospira paudalimensis]
MKHLIRYLLILFLGFMTSAVFSKEKAVYELHSKDELFYLGEDSRAQDSKEKWNLDELENFAVTSNPLYLREKQNIGMARGDVITASLYYNPIVNMQQQFMGASSKAATGLPETSIIYNQPFDMSGVIPQREKVAKQEFLATIASFRDFDRLFRLRLRQNFWTYLYVTEQINYQKEFLENYQDLLDLTKLRAEKGDISFLEYDRLALERVQIEREYRNARILRAQVVKNLRVLIGISDINSPLNIKGRLEFISTKEFGIDLNDFDIEERPDLVALKIRQQRERMNIELKKREIIPPLTLGVEFLNKGNENVAGVYAATPLPLFDRKQGEILKSEESYKKLGFDVDAKRNEILSEISAAIKELQARESQLLDYQKMGLLEKNKEVQEKSRLAYIRGASNLVTFLEAEKNYLSVLRSYYEIIYLYYNALEGYKASIGKMDNSEF